MQLFKAILISGFVLFLVTNQLQAQQTKLELNYTDKGSKALLEPFDILFDFSGIEECKTYLKDEYLPRLRKKGFLEVSVDSLQEEQFLIKAWVHLGPQYKWGTISIDSSLLTFTFPIGDQEKIKPGEVLSIEQLISLQETYLSILEENGYPFASVELDSSYFVDYQLYARLKAVRGPLYSIDSIHVEGRVKVNKSFLIQYLDLGDGSVYRKSILDLVSKRIAELGFIRESRKWNLSLTGTGAILNLYLEPAQSSRFNLLAGFMPSNEQLGGKLLLTGEAEMDLKNAFGGGENVFMNWQQLQVRSPRLQLGFMKPYVFNSNTGLDFNFNLFRKDSSFLTLNTRIGLRYEIKPRQIAKLFFHQYSSSLLDVDTLRVKQTKTLPSFIDATTSNVGIEFLYNTTDYFFNPQKGVELEFRLLGGIRKIKKNNSILQLKEGSQSGFNYNSLYDTMVLTSSQFRLMGKMNQYYKLGVQSTLKAGVQTGWLLGKQLLLNELFQIGGLKNLRGFDEESLFTSGYATGTLEYRYLLSRASYLFGFLDVAYVERRTIADNIRNIYGGMGMGILLETKTGVFSLAYAAGKRPDAPINFREAKIHFGFITLF